jgi:hypothetical protein
VRVSRRIHDHHRRVALRQVQSVFCERRPDAPAVVGSVPSRQRRCADGLRVDAGPLGLLPLLGRQSRPRPLAGEKTRFPHCLRDVLAPLALERRDDGPVVGARHERVACFVLGDAAELLPPCVIPIQANGPSVRPHPQVLAVLMAATMLDVELARKRAPFEAELVL